MLHLIGWESLDKPHFSLHVMLTAVMHVQFIKSQRIGLTVLIHTDPDTASGISGPPLQNCMT